VLVAAIRMQATQLGVPLAIFRLAATMHKLPDIMGAHVLECKRLIQFARLILAPTV